MGAGGHPRIGVPGSQARATRDAGAAGDCGAGTAAARALPSGP